MLRIDCGCVCKPERGRGWRGVFMANPSADTSIYALISRSPNCLWFSVQGVRVQVFSVQVVRVSDVPLPSELGTHTPVKARSWP